MENISYCSQSICLLRIISMGEIKIFGVKASSIGYTRFFPTKVKNL